MSWRNVGVGEQAAGNVRRSLQRCGSAAAGERQRISDEDCLIGAHAGVGDAQPWPIMVIKNPVLLAGM
jgi:predicted nucleic acid-binding protein